MRMDVSTTINKYDLGGVFHPGFFDPVNRSGEMRG